MEKISPETSNTAAILQQKNMKIVTFSIFLLIGASLRCNASDDTPILFDYGAIVSQDDFVLPRFSKFNNQRTCAENHTPLNEGHYPITKNMDTVTML